MRGRVCPCMVPGAADDVIVAHSIISTRSGGRAAMLDIRYDQAARVLLLQATRPGQTIRVVCAGRLCCLSTPDALTERFPEGIGRWAPPGDPCEYSFDCDLSKFWIETTMATGDVIVAASDLAVMVFEQHTPVVVDCRAPNTDTRTRRRWFRLPWNDEVDRRNDAWLPPRVTHLLERMAERALNRITR